MSAKVQIVVDEAELARFRAAADQAGMTLSEWARHALRLAERDTATRGSQQEIDAIHAASGYEFPAPDVDKMIAEIDGGALA